MRAGGNEQNEGEIHTFIIGDLQTSRSHKVLSQVAAPVAICLRQLTP